MAIVKLKTFFLPYFVDQEACMFKSCCQACCHASESWLVSFLTRCRKERGLMLGKYVVREMSVFLSKLF